MRWLLALAGLLTALAFLPSSASAATCSDYSNQADAQRAADTRDSDGDGVYCEDLPCPCLEPGDDSGGGSGGGGGSGDDSAPPPPPNKPKKPKKPKKVAQTIHARITAVVDGDTIKVRAFDAKRKNYTVRLIGIDTPETKKPGTAVECGGPEATSKMYSLAFTRPQDSDGDGLLDAAGGTGYSVVLRTDPTQDTFDRYGRLLAYVAHGSTSLAMQMLKSGWATTYVYGGKEFQQIDRFTGAEDTARDAERGVYDACGGDFHSEQS